MITPASLALTADGTPWSASFDDVYHSTEGGLPQAQHVFLGRNGLPHAWQGRHQFTILETGFGLGLSFLATWHAWRNDPQRCTRLHFISTELHPFTRADLTTLHMHWPELALLASELQNAWPPLTPGFHHLLLNGGRVTLTLLLGDALETLPQLVGKADAIYLDGFAPQKNPQLWSAALLANVTQHAAPGATLASWCVAGDVRKTLISLGWTVQKQQGFARKRHMLTARLGEGTTRISKQSTASALSPPTAIVIGAGIAGCSMTEALSRRGWHVTLIDQHAAPAQEASGNPAGLLHPLLARDDNLAARFSRAAYLYTLRLLHRLDANSNFWRECGILQLAEDEADATAQQRTCAALNFPADYVSWIDQAAASAHAGAPVGAGGWYFPHAAWVKPQAFCQALLTAAETKTTVDYRFDATATRIHSHAGQWHVEDADGTCIASADHLILANASAANTLVPDLTLTLRAIRGQLTYLPSETLTPLNTALCGTGYLIQPDQAPIVLGASFVEDVKNTALRISEHQDNLARLQALLPNLTLHFDPAQLDGRVSFRSASHDRLPLVGTLPAPSFRPSLTLSGLPRQAGLHAMLGFGARGLTWAPMAAEVIAAQLNNECLPLEQSVLKMLDPARYQLRKVRTEKPA